MFKRTPIAAALGVLVLAAPALAASSNFSNFTPLAASAGPVSLAGEVAPLTLSSPNFSQRAIADRTTQNALVPGSNSGSWDMIDTNRTGPDAGRYLFMPFETGTAGVQRVDLWNNDYNTRTVTIVAPGTQGFVSGDASRWTPWGGYVTAEESWGTGSSKGRLFEVTNATTATANGGNFVQRSIIPRVSHEGLAFDSAKAMYFVDELNGGAVYKFVSSNPNATNGNDYFASGQSFALRVGAGGQFEGTSGAPIVGASSWIAITNATGGAIAGVSTVLGDGTIDGRATADHASVLSSGFNRPEDLEIQTVGGTQRLYFTTTDSGASNGGTSRVYNLDVTTGEVKLFVDTNTIDLATGQKVGAGLKNADNLAMDADGNIYIIEDRNGGVDNDVWFARDLNKDGDLLDDGEGIGRWISNGTPGSETTGLFFSLTDPNKAYINIQHPNSGVDRLIEISAVPEPSSYAMLLGGLGLVGFLARRRKA